MTGCRAWLPVLAAAAVAAAGCERMSDTVGDALAGRRADGPTPDRVKQQLGEVPESVDTASAVRLSGAFRAAAAQALPAVVQITTIAVTETQAQLFPGFNLEQEPQRTQGSGSGFIFDRKGYILTNHHVVRNALNVNVVLLDGREFTAEVIGSDPSTDVAVLRVEGDGDDLPVIALGESDELRVGDWVLALGNPLGLTFTATAGIVSAKGRSLGILSEASDTPLEAFIQTDAAINPGNSGGPLVDLNGRVIGINTAIESGTGYFTGAGFAIPIDLARKVANDIVEYGTVHRPLLGVRIQDVNAADAEVYGLSAVAGVEIVAVNEGTPADRAGLQLGDVIVTIDDKVVNTVAELQSRIARLEPGQRVSVGYVRYGDRRRTTVQLGEFEAAPGEATPRERPQRDSNLLGFTVGRLPARLAARLGLRGDDIPAVSRVDPLGPAARSGLQAGHVIRRFNGREIRNVRDLERAAAGVSSGDVISLIAIDARGEDPTPTIFNYRAR